MIASLIASIQLFASDDPAAWLSDVQRIHEAPFDLRVDRGSLVFQAALPPICYFVTYSTYMLWDPTTGSYIDVYRHFPSFFSDATVSNHERGLDLYSQRD